MEYVSIKNLSFSYKTTNLFNDLDLQLNPGNIYGLLGINGVGKTTLLKLLLGLLFPQKGQIMAFNYIPSQRNPGYLSKVFLLPEEVSLPSISDSEYIKSYATFYPSFSSTLLQHCLSEFDMPRKTRLDKLSLGQKKKFLLSFGIACGASLLALDEPTNGMDIPSKSIFRKIIAETMHEKRTIIISTHQVKDMESLIDPIIILHNSHIIFSATLAQVSQQFHMRRSSSPLKDKEENLIHGETTVGAYWSVWKGGETEGKSINLEVLFNAIIANPNAFKELSDEK